MLSENAISQTRQLRNQYIWTLLDWLYPPFCCNCHQIGAEICPQCLALVDLMENRLTCSICGKVIRNGSICTECQHKKPAFDQLRSWAKYGGVAQTMIAAIKFHRRIGLVAYLSDFLIIRIKDWGQQFDLVMPVPLSHQRKRQRGYNQANWIAKPIAQALQLPYQQKALKRIRDTHSQVGLHAAERRINMADAFQADERICQDKTILIIDDIATTGATLNECAKALKSAGASLVFAFTMARTSLTPNSFS